MFLYMETKKSEYRCAVWDFTLSKKFCDDFELIKKVLKDIAKKWCFQEEKSLDNYQHYNGRISLFGKVYESQLHKVVIKDTLLNKAHWSRTSKECTRGNKFWEYCSKGFTRVGESHESRNQPLYIPVHVKKMKKLHNFQQDIIDSIGVIDELIHVVVQPIGGVGKSSIVNYVLSHRLGFFIPYIKNYKNIIEAVHGMVDSCPEKWGTPKQAQLFMLDLPKAINSDGMSDIFCALEDIKNGRIFDTRYKFQYRMINPPAIWVFTNIMPDEGLLSKRKFHLTTVINREFVKITFDYFSYNHE